MNARVAAEPALLAAGEAPGAHDGELQRVVEGGLTLNVGEQLLVAESLRRGAGDRVFGEGPHFVEEAIGELAIVPGCDALVELAAVPEQPDLHEWRGRIVAQSGPVGREGLAAADGDF